MNIRRALKTVVTCLFASALLLLQGCSKNAADIIEVSEKSDVPLVVSTIFPGYDFAGQVGGEKVMVYQLLKPGAESHTYEPTPQDMLLIEKCDVFIYPGGESDSWMSDILENSENDGRKIISMMDEVTPVEEEESEGMHEGGVLSYLFEEEEEEMDEHVWCSPANAALISKAVKDALKEVAPQYADIYEENFKVYEEKLTQLDEAYRQCVAGAKRKEIVVADRFPFRYLCDEYGLSYYAAYPGCSEDAEVTADTVITLCNVVNEKKIPVVFTIEFSSGKIADCVCECTNAKKLTLNSAHNVSNDDIKKGVSYISIMEDNLKNLREALY